MYNCKTIQSHKLCISPNTNINALPVYLKRISSKDDLQIEFLLPPSQSIQYLEAFKQGMIHFKNLLYLQIKVFRGNNIQEEGSKLIGQSIQHLKSLQSLTLSIGGINEIGFEGVQFLMNSIKNMVELSELYLTFDWGNYITFKGVQAISSALINLQNLNRLSITIDQNNEIGEIGAQFLGQGLSNLKQLQTLYISITSNDIGQIGAIAIGEGIKCLTNLTNLTLLIGAGNQIQTIGIKGLLKNLKLLPKLSYFEFIMDNNNNYDDLSIQELGLQLLPLVNLKELVLVLNNIEFSQNAISNFFNSFKNLIELLTLKIEIKFKMTNISLTELFKLLQSTNQLKQLSLDLTLDDITTQNNEILSESLTKMNELSLLNLNFNGKHSLNTIPIFNCIPQISQLSYLSLQFNDEIVIDNYFSQFSSQLHKLQGLQMLTLEVSQYGLNHQDQQLLLKSLLQLQQIKYLNISMKCTAEFGKGKQIEFPLKRKLKRLVFYNFGKYNRLD